MTDSGTAMHLSTADLKLAMASSGTVFSTFTVGHMLGNLQVYLGQERFNAYARSLRTLGAPLLPRGSVLWAARAVLLGSAVTHLTCATVLTLRARRARHSPRVPGHLRSRGRRRRPWTVLKRSMRSTGVVLGLFAAHHVADLTLGARPVATGHIPDAPYGNLVRSLRRPPVAVLYLSAMVALAAHTAHGITQVGHDTGAATDRDTREALTVAGRVIGTGVALGNASIPVAVLLRIVR